VVAGRVTLPVRLSTVDDTRAYGAKLADVLRAGDLVVLAGPLGAGKTALVQGIGAGLGVRGPIVSPTFVIARVHRGGRLPLVHVDAYRLGSFAEVDDLDLDVDLADSVLIVEWGSGKVEQLADSHLEIELARPPDSETRTLTLRPHGGDWPERVAALS
jgi:tRNA threonylcarbamoyladenosine biosynthesis protein TsaE